MNRKLAASALIVVFGVATAVKVFINEFRTSKPSPDAVSYSVNQAKSENVFIQEVQVEPGFIDTVGGSRPIETAWIEKNSDHAYFLIWFYYRREKEGYKIVLKPEEGNPLWSILMIPNERKGFSNINGGDLFYETIKVLPSWPFTIEHRRAFDKPPIQTLILSPKK